MCPMMIRHKRWGAALLILIAGAGLGYAQSTTTLPSDLDPDSRARLPYLKRADMDEANQKTFDVLPGRGQDGVLRGPLLGASFQGMLYDPKGNMDMTGTFMPAYGLNRIFGEIPIIGALLGNGRDHGLIGVTFKLEGDADSPGVQINPLSVIAPGIFRSIFEFR